MRGGITVIVMLVLCWQITALCFFIIMCVNFSVCQDGINNILVNFHSSSQLLICFFSSFTRVNYLKLQVGSSLLCYTSFVYPNRQPLRIQKVQLALIFSHLEANFKQPYTNSLSCYCRWFSEIFSGYWEWCWRPALSPLRLQGPLGLISIIAADNAKPWF